MCIVHFYCTANFVCIWDAPAQLFVLLLIIISFSERRKIPPSNKLCVPPGVRSTTGSSTPSMEPRPRIAVCVAGQVRTAVCPWRTDQGGVQLREPAWTIKEHVITPLRALLGPDAVDVFAALDAPPRERTRHPGIVVPALMELLRSIRPVGALFLGEADDERAFTSSARVRVLPNEPNGTRCQLLSERLSHFLSYNTIAQARKLGACWQMLTDREAEGHFTYTHIMRLRPDASFPEPLNRSVRRRGSDSTEIRTRAPRSAECPDPCSAQIMPRSLQCTDPCSALRLMCCAHTSYACSIQCTDWCSIHRMCGTGTAAAPARPRTLTSQWPTVRQAWPLAHRRRLPRHLRPPPLSRRRRTPWPLATALL